MIRVSLLTIILLPVTLCAQQIWINVDSLYQPLPSSVHIYKSITPLDGKPNLAYYIEADLKDKTLEFLSDTTHKRRLTLSKFYEKNDNPLVVVNTTFFSFATNQNLSVVVKNGKLVGHNNYRVNAQGVNIFKNRHPFGSAIGISKKRRADVAWIYTDSSYKDVYATEKPLEPLKDSSYRINRRKALGYFSPHPAASYQGAIKHYKWEMQTVVGGGPVLVQNGDVMITNNEELKFAGNAVNDRHPRTGMGYTANGKLVILVIEGRNPGKAEGATLIHEATMFKELGCIEALNLDGGGSSCMLVNGKETIKVSDAGGQRPVPAVFLIKKK